VISAPEHDNHTCKASGNQSDVLGDWEQVGHARLIQQLILHAEEVRVRPHETKQIKSNRARRELQSFPVRNPRIRVEKRQDQAPPSNSPALSSG
jgi:hypothetical protein